MIVTFDYDQQIAILAWLENLYESGMSLEEVIEGLESGHLTSTVTVTDKRYGQSNSHPSQSLQDSDLSRVPEEV